MIQAPGDRIHNTYFLRILLMGPISWSVTLQSERLVEDKHSGLLGPFVSCFVNTNLGMKPGNTIGEVSQFC